MIPKHQASPGSYEDTAFPANVEFGLELSSNGKEAAKDIFDSPPVIAAMEASQCLQWLRDEGLPFYIEALHLTRPFNASAVNIEGELTRVRREVDVALESARNCVMTEGGSAQFDATELDRRMSIMADRLVVLPSVGATSEPAERKDVCYGVPH